MPHILTGNIVMPPGKRLEVADLYEDRTDPADPDTVVAVYVRLQLRSAVATNRLYGEYTLIVRNAPGMTDRLRLRPVELYLPGMEVSAVLEVESAVLTLPTAMDDLRAAWGGPGRKVGLPNLLATLEIIDPVTLAGS